MKRLLDAIRDESKSMTERVFLLFGAMSLTAMVLVTVVGIATNESIVDLATIIVCFAVFFLLILIGLKTKLFQLTAVMCAVLVIFFLLPMTFFTSGGIYGGSPMWFIFCMLFVSMIVDGKARTVLMILNIVVAAACYMIAYNYPDLIIMHDEKAAHVDSFVSMLFIGTALSVMVGFEIVTLKKEMERSDEKSRKIEELNKSQSRFFSSMSHEIRTPINTIIGLDEMILREDISDEVADDARNIRSASKILLSLINDILDMSKMESGKMDIVPVIYDVGSMLSEIVAMISVMAEKKGLRFTIDVDPTMPAQLLSDEVRIKQIIINLLNNAVKYTQSGSVTLSVHCRRTENNKALVTYSVEDTGMGIRKESIPHLFDAFRRVDESKNRYIEGTGLGLSIVKQLVDLLGGEISVSSIYTKGSTFVFTLEQETAGDAEIGAFSMDRFHSEGSRLKGGATFEAPKARVLIVDDNKANILVAMKLLRRTKVITDSAVSGEECLRLTLENHYDAIFMDHMMPVMDGIECMHAVRAQSGGLCRETPIVILTANAGSENRALYRREGFDAYLVKPIDSAQLEETLVSVLPEDIVKIKESGVMQFGAGDLVRNSSRKVPLMITTDSISDLPRKKLDELGIPVIPYKVTTEKGIFDDIYETDGDMVIRCMTEELIVVNGCAPDVSDYEEFFAEQLSRAQHIIHISSSKRVSEGFANASEAALSFYNVDVVDSGQVSSGTGIIALEAAAKIKNEPFSDSDDIMEFIGELRERIQSCFLLNDTNYLLRMGLISDQTNKLLSTFMAHPVMQMKNNSLTVGEIFFGDTGKTRRSYIKKLLRDPDSINKDTLFITYSGMKSEEIEDIRKITAEFVDFSNVYLQKASPASCARCGSGTFGLLFARK